jgi:osmotically-inducible protein OsmY
MARVINRYCGLEGCPRDAEITARVQAALDKHAELGPPDSIRVQTLNGVVYLNGLVEDVREMHRRVR